MVSHLIEGALNREQAKRKKEEEEEVEAGGGKKEHNNIEIRYIFISL